MLKIWAFLLFSLTALAADRVAASLPQAEEVSVQEYYSALLQTYEQKDWKELIKYAQTIQNYFPETIFAAEAPYYLGIAYFHLEEFEQANKHFSSYLKKQTVAKYFESAIQFKFQIAEKFGSGAGKHLLGVKALPKWSPATEDALEIYDEVITALPHSDLGAHALFAKAKLLLAEREYKSCLEALQTLIRRFPTNPLAIESYIAMSQVYLDQSQQEYPDPDLLDLAEINLRKFREAFPGEEKVAVVQFNLRKMCEIYAQHLFEIGDFFERTKKRDAAIIYYKKIILAYPESDIANKATKRLQKLEQALSK